MKLRIVPALLYLSVPTSIRGSSVLPVAQTAALELPLIPFVTYTMYQEMLLAPSFKYIQNPSTSHHLLCHALSHCCLSPELLQCPLNWSPCFHPCLPKFHSQHSSQNEVRQIISTCLLKALQWLSILVRVKVEVLITGCNAQHGQVPLYFSSRISYYFYPLLTLPLSSWPLCNCLYVPGILLSGSGTLFLQISSTMSLFKFHLLMKDYPFILFTIGTSFTSCPWNKSPFLALFFLFPWYLWQTVLLSKDFISLFLWRWILTLP